MPAGYKSTTPISPKKIVAAYRKHGSLKEAARRQFKGVSWTTVLKNYREAVKLGLMPAIRVGAKTTDQLKSPTKTIKAKKGSVKALKTKIIPLHKEGVKRYIFTSAQNNTDIFLPFWKNLMVLKDFYNAELHVARYVYLTNGTSSLLDKQQAFERMAGEKREKTHIEWPVEIKPYESDQRMEVAPGLVWCGEMNILPTEANPLSGLEVYTGRKSGIFPHAKLALASVPTSKHAPAKLNFTTGTVTKRNYIQRKAGLKAEFHHCYSALLVEVDSTGNWFVRQINADSEGVIFDLDIKVSKEELTRGNAVEAIVWGDIHVAQMEPWVADLNWLPGGMLDTLRPKYQFFHDVLDFRAKSHHETKMPHRLFLRYLKGETDVKRECSMAHQFIMDARRDWCENVIVDSNHHDHLGRWLEETDGRFDAKNFEFWTDMQQAALKAMRDGAENPDYFLIAMEYFDKKVAKKFNFLERDQSFIICGDKNGGIECGSHGHSGPDGSRGSARAFSRLGRKANLGHYHKATILDGIYTGGTQGKLDPDWTKGASSWTHSDILTYANGKRCIVTKWNGKWRA